MNNSIIRWLLKSDPSVVFQTKRDLFDLPNKVWKMDQDQILSSGWGKCLLDLQENSGRWGVKLTEKDFKYGKGLYGPKYISTHYTLLLLKRLEMPLNPQTTKGCKELLKLEYIRSVFDETAKRTDLCIVGMALSIFSHFRYAEDHFDDILAHFEQQKVEDGGWNCRNQRIYTPKTKHFSLNTTISVLEGLASLEKNYPRYSGRVKKLRSSAHDVLLKHELFKSHRTGEIIHENYVHVTFPPRWKYNILSALDYFQSINYPYDDRMYDAIEIILSKSIQGYWYQGKQLSGKKFFTLSKPKKPSPFNTLRALRVLKNYRI